ncbi:hypothetical protein AB0D11_45585 [Streptomyces monashensis]
MLGAEDDRSPSVSACAGPLEDYAARFDDLFFSLAQRRGFRDYLTGLLAPRERSKTTTCLVGAATAHVGRQHLGRLGKTDNGVVTVTCRRSGIWYHEQVRRQARALLDAAMAPPGMSTPTPCGS